MKNIKTFEGFFDFIKKKKDADSGDILTVIDECFQEIVDDGYTVKYRHILPDGTVFSYDPKNLSGPLSILDKIILYF